MTSILSPEPNLLLLQGEVDLHDSPMVREQLRRLLIKKPHRFYIDMSGVTYIDSSGLATLIEAMQRIHAYGGELALFGIRDSTMNIFRIARLDHVFRVFPDRTAADQGLKEP